MSEDEQTTLLPCDVMVAPNTIIRKGCSISTLLLAIPRRDGKEGVTWDSPPRLSSPAEDGGIREALEKIAAETDEPICCNKPHVGYDSGGVPFQECCGSPSFGFERVQDIARAALNPAPPSGRKT